MEKEIFWNAIDFSTMIENLAWEKNIDVLEALTVFVTENSIEEETIPPLLTPALKMKIEEEARKRYIMPKKTTEEIDL